MTASPASPNTNTRDISPAFNRIAYGAFVLLAVYFFIFSDDKMNGPANLGIALIFDPFDAKMSWTKRPFWQKAWLIVHLAAVFAGFAWAMK